MKLDFSMFISIEDEGPKYRKRFLKRKNVQGYKRTHKNTPVKLDKLLNSFDRKIKGKSIFSEKVKKEYFDGLNQIFLKHYEELNENRLSRRDAHVKYIAENFKTTGRGSGLKNNISELLSFKEFVKQGLCNKYR